MQSHFHSLRRKFPVHLYNMSKMKTGQAVLLCLMLAGIGLLGGGVVTLGQRYMLCRNGITVQGTVTSFSRMQMPIGKARSSASYVTVYYPVVEFDTPDGVAHTFLSSVGDTHWPDLKQGGHVQVIYMRGDPSSAQINTFNQLWGGSPLSQLLFGAALIALSWICLGVARGGPAADFARLRGLPGVLEISGKVETVRCLNSKDAPRLMAHCLAVVPGQGKRGFTMTTVENLAPGDAVTIWVNPENIKDYFVVPGAKNHNG